MNPELRAKMQVWRDLALRNELTLEQSREALEVLREGRLSAAPQAKVKAEKAAKVEKAPEAQVSFDDI